MKKEIILSVFILYAIGLFALHTSLMAQQTDTLTLSYCYKLARENYPILKQSEMFPEITKLKLKNLNVNYYPSATINGQATYQSAVTELPIHIPNINIPQLDKDMYKLNLGC